VFENGSLCNHYCCISGIISQILDFIEIAVVKRFSLMLTLENISKCFGTQQVLNGLNYHFKPKTIYALMGANGSGKTTLYNLIGGFLPMSEGKVFLNGVEVSRYSPHERANLGLGRTFQDMRLIPSLSVYDNILMAMREKPSEKIYHAFLPSNKAYMSHKIVSILKQTHLEEVQHHNASDISYGQQKLLNLAVAMANDFELLLLDEPVAGVQPEFREEILKLIQSFNKTVIVIEHNPEFLERLTEHILFLNDGNIIVEGDYQTIKSNKQVQEAYL
jgi:branched-chain amino acid transport system ATP-binding protein